MYAVEAVEAPVHEVRQIIASQPEDLQLIQVLEREALDLRQPVSVQLPIGRKEKKAIRNGWFISFNLCFNQSFNQIIYRICMFSDLCFKIGL